MANTLSKSGYDAGIVRINNSNKAISMSCDVNPRYCSANAKIGATQAVSECWRNIIASGAKPLAITNCLNFGNPEKPEIMSDFVDTIRGITEASIKLDYPVVSGNVSLYNETNGSAIKNTPTIGGVGLIEDIKFLENFGDPEIGDEILLIGKKGQHLSCSTLEEVLYQNTNGQPPEINLNLELNTGKTLLSLIQDNTINSCHDISDGGMIIAICEMLMRSKLGAKIDISDKTIVEELFGEDQSRYIVAVSPNNRDQLISRLKKNKVENHMIGKVLKEELKINNNTIISNSELCEAYENTIPSIMNN
jgi:phosphoribosylformylglycinamidine synthase